MRIRHLRHRRFERLRHSHDFKAWLAAQATRLGTTSALLFARLRAGYSSQSIDLETAWADPVNTVAPAITGTAQVGQTLTTTNGTWTGKPTPVLTRQWKKDDVAIPGATGLTYVPVVGDVGAVITVTVTATSDAGPPVSATSSATSAVIAA